MTKTVHICLDCGMRGFHTGDCPARVGNDAINPKHYAHPSGIQTIQVNRRMTFDMGNAFKYVLRHREKGNPLQDLTKARWYIADAVNHNDPIFNNFEDRAKAAMLLAKMLIAEPHEGTQRFFVALIDMDLMRAGDAVDEMMEEYR